MLGALLVGLLMLPGTPAAARPEWPSYASADPAFRLSYPPDWRFKPPNEDKRLFVTSPQDGEADQFRENVNIGVFRIAKPRPLAAMETEILTSLRGDVPQFKLLSKNFLTWSGRTALRIEYTAVKSVDSVEHRLRIMQQVLMVSDVIYVVTYTALEKDYFRYLPTAERILLSFKVD